MPNYNWIPESFEEFRRAAWQGRVDLGILPKQYAWLYANALPFSTFKKYKYEKRLLRRMAEDRDLFQKVHNYGIDLILHATPITREEFTPTYRRENLAHAALTLAAVSIGALLWSDGWHWLVIYLLPCVAFALAGAVINSLKDERDQINTTVRVFQAAVWPLLLVTYFIERGSA